jgi:hypothetical protein
MGAGNPSTGVRACWTMGRLPERRIEDAPNARATSPVAQLAS